MVIDMKNVVKAFLERNSIKINNESICIAVSTGVDSMALLYSLIELKEDFNFNIVICHVNHKKRKQSEEEEQFITTFSKENNLKIEIHHLDLAQIEDDNFQSAARIKRLEFFNEVMNKYNCKYLFLGHHLNDDIETSIMHIIRGSNLKGYSGIDEVVYNNDNKIILRPFLRTLKQDLIEYCHNNNIKYYEDESNSTDLYTRNRVRHNITNELFNENSGFEKQFLEFKETIINSYYIVCEKRDEFIKNNCIINNDNIEINIIEFNKLNKFLKTECLFYLLKEYQLSKKNINEIIKLMNTNKANLIIDYKNITFCKQYDRVIIKNKNEKKNKNINILIEKVGVYDIDEKYQLKVEKYTEEDYKKNKINLTNLYTIWYNSSMFPFVLRNRQNGDIMKLSVGTKKVKDILIDEKIPIDKRNELLLIEKDEEILNIFGVKKSSTILNSKQNNILITLREKQ